MKLAGQGGQGAIRGRGRGRGGAGFRGATEGWGAGQCGCWAGRLSYPVQYFCAPSPSPSCAGMGATSWWSGCVPSATAATAAALPSTTTGAMWLPGATAACTQQVMAALPLPLYRRYTLLAQSQGLTAPAAVATATALPAGDERLVDSERIGTVWGGNAATDLGRDGWRGSSQQCMRAVILSRGQQQVRMYSGAPTECCRLERDSGRSLK